MNKPEMIIFDYGHTLIYEPYFNRDRGNEAVLNHAVKNPSNCTASQLSQLYYDCFEELSGMAYNTDTELRALNKSLLTYDYFGLEFDVSPVEIERIFWDNAGPGSPMPHIEQLIDFINDSNIRSAVISNISFSSENLSERINRLVPNNRFEFIMASCEYVIRKPNKYIFETALKKARIDSGKVWYCGDNRRVDVMGSAGAGMFPVWYDSGVNCQYRSKKDEIEPSCDYLRVGDWLELRDILRGL